MRLNPKLRRAVVFVVFLAIFLFFQLYVPRDYIFTRKRRVSILSEGAAREWSTVAIVIVFYLT